METVSEFLSACSAALHGSALAGWLPATHGAGLLLLGLTGGAVHCAGMCGPFVLGQVGSRLAAMPVEKAGSLSRLRGMALLPYHAGRTTTYAMLGGAAAGMAGGAQHLILNGMVPALALLLAAGLLAMVATMQLLPAGGARFAPGLRRYWQNSLAPLFRQPTGLNGYALGIALGFLPCGFLYAALLMAGASGSWQSGALGMALFGIGTAPALMVVGFLGAAAGQRWRRAMKALLPLVLLLNAGVLALLALRWLGV
ncbi:MAG: sulfite exporter TauE/SafE family protein [Ferrovibrio sp.]